jgi:hypothetical protein
MHLPAAAVTTLLAVATATAQHGELDARDSLVRTDGKQLAGRVVNTFAPDELVLLQQGKRVRVPRAELRALDLVADRVREFCQRRVALHGQAKAQWFLVEWAATKGLAGLARTQALALVLADDGLERAHEFLGHKRSPKGWLWPHDERWLLRDQLLGSLAETPCELVGERFALRCDGGLQAAVLALLDLERLGVAWFDTFGAALRPDEVLSPLRVVVHRTADEFPKWGFRPLPYYVPPPHGDEARTFYTAADPGRPQRLFFVGTQALLYRTLVGEVARASDRDRACPWLEIGLGMWFENTLQGPPGRAVPGPPKAQDLQAMQALARRVRLVQLLHLPMYGGYYLTDDTATAVHWAASTMFVAWLLEPGHQPPTREPFLEFVRQALAERKGDSSSAFDQAMGQKVEALEEPWLAWLTNVAGY